MPGKLRIAARSDLLSAMRRKIASSVSFLPTTTSMMEATLACCATMGGGAGFGRLCGGGLPAAGDGAAACGTAAAIGAEALKRQPRKISKPNTEQATAHDANTLIREEFFQNPRMLRGTSNPYEITP